MKVCPNHKTKEEIRDCAISFGRGEKCTQPIEQKKIKQSRTLYGDFYYDND